MAATCEPEPFSTMPGEIIHTGFARPLRETMFHEDCGGISTMGTRISALRAHRPNYQAVAYCSRCHVHRPTGEDGEFLWVIHGAITEIKVGT